MKKMENIKLTTIINFLIFLLLFILAIRGCEYGKGCFGQFIKMFQEDESRLVK